MKTKKTAHARKGAFGAALALATLGADARAEEGWLVRLAYETGGDELGTAVFVGGDDETIEAGGAFHVEAGLRRRFFGEAWESDLTAGYKSDTATARNGSVGFTRFTLNALQYYLVGERLRLGGGVSYHLSPEFEVDIDGQVRRTFGFDDALGVLLALDYRVGESWELGARATRIEYELSDVSGAEPADGESIGGYFTYRF